MNDAKEDLVKGTNLLCDHFSKMKGIIENKRNELVKKFDKLNNINTSETIDDAENDIESKYKVNKILIFLRMEEIQFAIIIISQ